MPNEILSSDDVFALLDKAANAKRQPRVINEHAPRWPSDEHKAQILAAVKHLKLSVLLDGRLFKIHYYRQKKWIGSFFIQPVDTEYVPCGVFVTDRLEKEVSQIAELVNQQNA